MHTCKCTPTHLPHACMHRHTCAETPVSYFFFVTLFNFCKVPVKGPLRAIFLWILHQLYFFTEFTVMLLFLTTKIYVIVCFIILSSEFLC